MKKIFFALALTTFVGSLATTTYAAVNGNSVEIKKDDKKKKKKKGCCSAEKNATGSSCTKSAEGKSGCCSKKQ
jgi:hypothetical protein